MADNQLVKCDGCGAILEADGRLALHRCPPKVGLVGYGRWGREWARVLQGLDALSWVADTAVDAEWRPGNWTFSDLPYALTHAGAVDAAVVATPPDTHRAVVDALLDAGVRAVLVEKPLATCVDDARHMVDRAREVGATLCVGHTFLHTPGWARVMRVREDYGTPRLVEARWHQPPGAVPASAWAAGLLWDLGPHPLSLILAVAPPVCPNVVRARAGCVRAPRDWVDFELVWYGGYDFRAHVHLDALSHDKRRSVQLTSADGAVRLLPTSGMVQHGRWGDTPQAGIASDPPEALHTQAKWFLDLVHKRTNVWWPMGNGKDGLRVVEILQLVEEAL